MRVTLDLRKTVEENAQHYFEAAKKARKKAAGAEKTVAAWRAKALVTVEEKQTVKVAKAKRKKEWYENFRWCFSSDGFLLVGGRDATTNELLVKKHAMNGDIVFHTDMAGSPFIIIKAEGKDVPPRTMEEAAQFAASFSRAWKNGFSVLEVFHVNPDQVTKEANAGEFLAKGAFTIRGKTTYHRPELRVAVGIDQDCRIFSGPPSAVEQHAVKAVEVLQGNEKTSDVAKSLKKLLGGDLDEIVASLPPGGCKVGKLLTSKLKNLS